VWAGDATVLLEIAPLNGDSRTDTLHVNSDPRAIPLGRATLQLVRLEPRPVTTAPIASGDYAVTLIARSP
jgi:hypothetical protein